MSVKISALPAASGLTGTELFETVQAGASTKSTPAQNLAYILQQLNAGVISNINLTATNNIGVTAANQITLSAIGNTELINLTGTGIFVTGSFFQVSGADFSLPDGAISVQGSQVITAQQPAIANSTVLLTDVVAKFNTLLAELRTHGLIAT